MMDSLRGLLLHRYTCTFHEADTSQERRHACGVRANTKRSHKLALNLINKFKEKMSTRAYVGNHDSGDRAEKYGVTAHER
jgi:hypothetical protein